MIRRQFVIGLALTSAAMIGGAVVSANVDESVSNQKLGEFIERQRKELRTISQRLTAKQRMHLGAHVAFYGDEITDFKGDGK